MRNIFLIGPMGVGKTSTGRVLAKELGMNFHDSDQVIEKRAGADILWIYDLEGEEGFRRREQIINELVKLPGVVIATGGGTVITPENRSALAANGTVIYLRATLDDQLRRTGYSKKRPLADDPSERRDTLEHLRFELEPLYEDLADIIYDTENKASRTIVTDLIVKIENYFR